MNTLTTTVELQTTWDGGRGVGEGGAVGVMGVGVALPEETNQHRRVAPT